MTNELLYSISFYGLATLFVKAGIIIIISHSLYDQLEFSPASIKHNIWLLTFISLALLPLLSASLPVIELPILSASIFEPGLAQPDTVIISYDSLIMVYILVIILKLIRLINEVFQIAKASSNSVLAPQKWQQFCKSSNNKTVVKVSSDIDSPLTWGAINPIILLPERARHWPQDDLEMVLLHESAHITRRDWLSQLLAQCVCILYWPIPGIQRILKTMSLEAEQSADDEVLRSGKTAPEYAQLLVKQARIVHLQATVALGKPSELGLRVNHIISHYIDRSHINTLRRILISCCWLSLVPLAAIKTTVKIEAPLQLSPTIPTAKVRYTEPKDFTFSPPALAPLLNKPQRPISASQQPKIEETSLFYVTNLHIENDKAKAPSLASPIEIGREKFSPKSLSLASGNLPKYPQKALNKSLEGYVIVEFDVDTLGHTQNPRIIESSHVSFNNTVKKAVSEYRYNPAVINHQETKVTNVQEKFIFQLTAKSSVLTQARASPN